MIIAIECRYCNTKVNTKRLNQVYCNMSCRNKDYKNRFIGKLNPFFGKKLPMEVIKKKRSLLKGKRISPRTEFKKGSKSANWKGGKYKNSAGYVYIYSPNHPKKTSTGYVRQHILVVEEFLGRHLINQELVHHINCIKDDNRIENLMVLSGKSPHSRIHLGKKLLDSEIILDGRMYAKDS